MKKLPQFVSKLKDEMYMQKLGQHTHALQLRHKSFGYIFLYSFVMDSDLWVVKFCWTARTSSLYVNRRILYLGFLCFKVLVCLGRLNGPCILTTKIYMNSWTTHMVWERALLKWCLYFYWDTRQLKVNNFCSMDNCSCLGSGTNIMST